MTNAIRPLSLFQSGPEAVAASGTLHMATKPTVDDTVTIGGVVYTFKASASAPGQVTIGALVTNSQTNLVAAINGLASPNTSPNPYVTAAAFGSNNMVVTARVKGAAGNAIATVATLVAGAPDVWGAATLASGSEARGTPAAATSRFVFPIDFESESPIERTPYAIGLAWANRGNENIVSNGVKGTILDHPVNFEMLPLWLHWALKGNVKPTGAAAPLTYVYAPPNSADPGVRSRTVQRRLSDGTNNIDDQWSFCMLDSLNLKWQQRKNMTLGGSFFGRKRTNATWTTGVSGRRVLTQVPAALLTVFIDDTLAAIGNTQVLSQIISGDMAFALGMSGYEAADGRETLDFSDYEFDANAKMFTLKFRSYVKNASLASNERDAAEAAAPRFVRIAAEDPATNQSFAFDFVAMHTAGSQIVKMTDVNGQEAIDLELVQTVDDPSDMSTAFVMSATVVSNGLTDS